MRTVITFIILILTLFYSCSGKKENTQNPEFENLIIDYWTGDEAYVYKRMEFTKKGNKIFGKIIRPEYKISEKTVISEDIDLTSDKINLLNEFWKKANKFKDSCEQKYISSSIQDYTIIRDLDTIKIDQFCDWQKYSYENIEKVIFLDFFKKLTDDRKNLELELSKKLNGTWYPMTIEKELKRGEFLKLTKNKSKALDKDCYWEFSNQDEFKSNCPNLLDLKLSKSYNWDVDEGKTYFVISGGFKTREEKGKKYTSVANYGATFIVKSIKENNIELEYMWD
jgi:hypothetical protein